MTATLFLLRRYLFPGKHNLLGLALWVAVVGVALGIVQLMVVLSVMSGFQKIFQDSYTRFTSEIVIIPRDSSLNVVEFEQKIKSVPGMGAITPFSMGQGMVLKNGVAGVVLEGTDLATSGRVTPWKQVWVEKPLAALQEKESHWIWLGVQLANKLKVKPGDSVNVLIADSQAKRIIPFVVTAITKFGIYDHDLHYARIDLRVLNQIFKQTDVQAMYKTKVAPGASIDAVARRLRLKLGDQAVVKEWSQINQNIFLAVEHQKKLLFLVLEIVVALAAMNVVNLLMMSSHHRRRDIAILRAMGMRLRNVVWFFVAQGAMVGLCGIGLGVSLGFLVCELIRRVKPAVLNEAIYNVTQLPVKIELRDVGIVCGTTFVVCVLFSLMPALHAALSRPVNALRYE